MAASSFVDVCRFNPTAGGTTDFTYSSAVTGYQSPTAAAVTNGAQYSYRAESADLTQWEVGQGTYNTGTGVLARTTVLFNSSGTTAKINFSAAPQIALVALAEDMVPQRAGQLPGTATNDNASAGNVGEYITASRANASSLALTSNTQTNIVSTLSLTAGDWDVSGVVAFSPGGSTVTTVLVLGINTVSATVPGADSGQQSGSAFGAGITGGGTMYLNAPVTRISVSVTTTVYLVANATFTTSSLNAWGNISARRVR